MNNTPVALGLAVASLAALAAGMAGQALALGILAVALIVLLCMVGLQAPRRTSRLTVLTLVAYGAAFCALLAFSFHLHDSTGPLTTIGGFPAGTAMLIYGIAPLGVTLGVLYGLTFDREILPLEKQQEFLKRFSKK